MSSRKTVQNFVVATVEEVAVYKKKSTLKTRVDFYGLLSFALYY
jgi:hypothetical protein